MRKKIKIMIEIYYNFIIFLGSSFLGIFKFNLNLKYKMHM